jgi:glucose/arabinose dehydrogenase
MRRSPRTARSGVHLTLSALLLLLVPACDAEALQPVAVPAITGSPTAGEAAAQPGQSPELAVRPIATGLDTPWSLAFAPDGRLFFTERGGRVRVFENGRLRPEPVITLPVRETAEGGLMGLALDPGFPEEPYLYTMYTVEAEGGLRNRVARLHLEGETAREDRILLEGLPAASIHDGGRLRFGPDDLLYVTLGDASEAPGAQEPGVLAGKIVRLNRDGTVPPDNPFPDSPVYTLGHRNSQGLAWEPNTGRLLATEHGATGNDEVNLIEAGLNYGWPAAQGADHRDPYRSPLAVYSPAIAPAGATFYSGDAIPRWRGSFLFATLRGTHLHRIRFDPQDPTRILEEERLYEGEYGRLRDVVQGPDGALYVATSNRDGRGGPNPDDDRILRIGPG